MSAPVGRGFESRNDASRARLAGILVRLTDPDLDRVIDTWTVSANLAHLAFWDRFMLERWQIEGRHAEEIAHDLVNAFNRYCGPASSSAA